MPVKRKDGLWQQQVTVTQDGRKAQKYFYGRTKQEVLEKILADEGRRDAGPSFSAVADDWWEDTQKRIAYNSTKNYHPAYLRARARFGEIPIRSITPAMAAQFLQAYISDANPAQKTLTTQRLVLSLIFKHACATGAADTNPVRDLPITRGKPGKPRPLPSDRDIRAVRDSVFLPGGLLPYFAMYSGLRKGELLALRWDDIDLDEREIHVTKSLYHAANHPHIKEPKTDAGTRTVPIIDRLAAVLQPSSGLVFPNSSGELFTETQFQKLWRDYVAKAGISCTMHQLRHVFATILYESGVDAKDAQYILGHSSLQMTLDLYTHIRETRRKKVSSKIMSADIKV